MASSDSSLILTPSGLLSNTSLEDFWSPIRERFKPLGNPQDIASFRDQPKQSELLGACGVLDWWNNTGPLKEPIAKVIGYGGAAFGGKTYGMLGLANICALAFPGVQMALFRRTYAEMEGPDSIIHKAHEIFLPSGAKKRDEGKHWYWERTGSDFYLRHCEYETDVYKYQGTGIDILLLDEATHFSWMIVDYLLTRNRASCQSIIKPFALFTSNPGNIGHAWFMKLFDLDVDKDGVPGMKRWEGATEPKKVINPNEKMTEVFFIPAYMRDNPIGMERDPDYEKSLDERDKSTGEALKEGNWQVFQGQYFKSFSKEKHVITWAEYSEVKKDWWPVWRSVDRGWWHPFFVLWFTMNPANKRVYVIRELTGQSVPDQQQALTIAMNTPHDENISLTFAGHDFWVSKNINDVVKTTADEYNDNGVPVFRADTDRINGWKKILNAMEDGADGKPMLQFLENCTKLIDILPKLSTAENNRDDVQKQEGDDAADALRYGFTNIDMFWVPGETEDKDHYPRSRRKKVNEWDLISKDI